MTFARQALIVDQAMQHVHREVHQQQVVLNRDDFQPRKARKEREDAGTLRGDVLPVCDTFSSFGQTMSFFRVVRAFRGSDFLRTEFAGICR